MDRSHSVPIEIQEEYQNKGEFVLVLLDLLDQTWNQAIWQYPQEPAVLHLDMALAQCIGYLILILGEEISELVKKQLYMTN